MPKPPGRREEELSWALGRLSWVFLVQPLLPPPLLPLLRPHCRLSQQPLWPPTPSTPSKYISTERAGSWEEEGSHVRAPEASWGKPLFLYLFIHFKQGWHFPSGSTDRTCDFDIPALVDGEGNENNFPQAKIIQDSKSHSWLFFFFSSWELFPFGSVGLSPLLKNNVFSGPSQNRWSHVRIPWPPHSESCLSADTMHSHEGGVMKKPDVWARVLGPRGSWVGH